MRTPLQARYQFPLVWDQHTCLAPQVKLSDKKRDKRRGICELLLLFYDQEGYGRHPEHDRWEFYQMLILIFLDTELFPLKICTYVW